MDLVIDANILFAALIRDGVTSDLMIHDDIHLYAPGLILKEFEEYRELIMKKTNRSDEEFNMALNIFQRRIKLVSQEQIKSFVEKAESISPDIKDVPYVALALKLNIAIWSNDKALKDKQKRVTVYSTEDLITLLE